MTSKLSFALPLAFALALDSAAGAFPWRHRRIVYNTIIDLSRDVVCRD